MPGLYAQEPLFVVTFWWSGFAFGINPNSFFVKYCTSYAYRELTTTEFPIEGGFAYGFLKSLTGLNTNMQIDGFGQVNQLSAEFVDYFGHFRYWMTSRNIYTELMVEVGLYFRNPNSTPDNPLKGTLYKVFEGKIREPVIWNEADRTFKCDFVSDTWFKPVGYVPAIQNTTLQRFVPDPPMYNEAGQQVNEGVGVYKPYIDTERLLLQQNINSDVWPQLFGRSTNIPLTPIAETPVFEVQDDVPCQYGYGRNFKSQVREAFVQDPADLALFDTAALVIPLSLNNQYFMAIERDYKDYPYNPAIPESPPPYPYQPHIPEQTVVLNNYKSIDPLIPQNMMTIDLESEGETIRCAGYLIDHFLVIPTLQYFNMPLVTNIPCTKAHQSYENPDYLLWQDYNSPAAAGKLTPSQQAFAAGSIPPQWIERPDYESSMLRLPCMRVVVNARTSSGSNVLSYDQYYSTDSFNISVGWYFVYAGGVYVVTVAPIVGGHELVFDPPLPTDMSIELNTHIYLCPVDTPWLQNQYISFNLQMNTPIYSTTQATTPNGDLLYLDSSGNLTIKSKDSYGNLNATYYTVVSHTSKEFVLYARVAKQIGADIYLENMATSEGINATGWLAGPQTVVTLISTVTGNLSLLPNSMNFRITELGSTTKDPNKIADQRRKLYLQQNAVTPYSQFIYNQITPYYKIKANSKMFVIDWWASHTYVMTTEIGQPFEFVHPEEWKDIYYFRVYIEKLWAEINGRPISILGPRSGQLGDQIGVQYRRNDYWELDHVLLFLPVRRSSDQMHDYYNGIYYPSENSTTLEWPNHVSVTIFPTPFILMLQGMMANTQQLELKAAACNTLNSDEKIFKAVLENHTPYFYSDMSDLITEENIPYDPYGFAYEHQNMGVITESTDVREFLAKLAWENAKHIQIRGNYAALVDFFKCYNPMITFTADNIDAKSITYEYTSFSDIINQYNITLTDGGLWIMKGSEPISTFDYSTLKSTMYGFDLNSWKKEDVEIKLNQTFRPDDFNLDFPIFDGYIHLSNLYMQFLAAQRMGDISENSLPHYPVDPPTWLKQILLYPLELAERSINSVLHWWLHYKSRVWTLMTFKTYVDENNRSFYLRAGDIVRFDLSGPTVKLFEDEQPPLTPSGPALESGYPMERIDGPATAFDHTKINYYTKIDSGVPGQEACTGLALVLSTDLDPEEWLITVKVLIPRTAEGTY